MKFLCSDSKTSNIKKKLFYFFKRLYLIYCFVNKLNKKYNYLLIKIDES